MIAYKDTTLMPFGKHKGKALANVPASYLIWLHGTPDLEKVNPSLKKYLDDNKDALKLQAKTEANKQQFNRR